MKVLFREEEIRQRICSLGQEISSFYEGKALTLLALANGGLFFGCDLSREITVDHWFDTISISTYQGDRKVSAPELCGKPKLDVKGRHLLIVDDIFDSGEAMEFIRRYLEKSEALSVRCAALLHRKVPGRKDLPDWHCFQWQGSEFFVGWGMDYDEKYRNLRCIGLL